MIKELIFAAALVVPGLAYAGDPSADLSTQIVPAAPSPTPPPPGAGIACDQGPNAAAIPAPAQAAGFTHCFLNADFSSTTTDGNGINYSNPNTFALNCGASRGPHNTVFEMKQLYARELHNGNPSVNNTPCSRAIIRQDPAYGNNMFDFEALKSDLGTCSGVPGDPPNSYPTCSGTDIQAISWPASFFDNNGGGPYNRGLQHAILTRLVYRMPISGLQQDPSAVDQQFLPYAFWYNNCREGGCPGGGGGFTEIDFFELFSNTCGINGGNANTNYCMPGFNTSPGTIWNTPYDVTVYNTVDTMLTTPDGVHFTDCQWVNGVLEGTGNGGTPHCESTTLGAQDSFGGSLENWTNVGCGFVSPGCNLNDIHIFIKSMQVWSCANMWNGICTGTVITSSNEPEPKFGWLSRAAKAVMSLL